MNLSEFFKQHNKVAIAFSGGVDSSYLLYAAKNNHAVCHAYYVKSVFQPQFELDDAKHLAQQLQVPMTVIETDVLCDSLITDNPVNRCYFCKKRIFSSILNQARIDGYTEVLDGTNSSDSADDRPGMRAIEELHVFSPLQLCGLTKSKIRRLSKEAGLFTWSKPAYACLATRIPTGTKITMEALASTETAESYLFSLGFDNFRVRLLGNNARIQITQNQIPLLIQYRSQILHELKKYYDNVLFDLEVRDVE